ncbi:uncharacterized protein LOC142530463 [Primulina tabacum]|uniref:uncharacterized protein LOC142530463 n=1 Tax=Primulina tabacum TaxID=48773 RepID=UPI003F5A3A3F
MMLEDVGSMGQNSRWKLPPHIQKCKERMENLRDKLYDEESITEFKELNEQLASLLLHEEDYWHQRAKQYWLKDGDRNTRFFHTSASARKQTHKMNQLKDVNGNWQEEQSSICEVVHNYFQNLFSEVNNTPNEGLMEGLDEVQPCVMNGQNEEMLKPFTTEEFREAGFDMKADKSPGLDGFNPAFFQRFWTLIGTYVVSSCVRWLHDTNLPPKLNDTNVVLIPKCKSPQSMKYLRPISLYNVLYKIISKVLANRLKKVLPHIISPFQSALVAGRAITDNVHIAFEIIHHMKRQTRGNTRNAAVKIDISKAYDRIDWAYLLRIMEKLGFAPKWIQYMKLCVTTVKYSFLVNGQAIGPITPHPGLRQGDPLSPYLFILCTEGLSALIRNSERLGQIHGIKACRGAPSISHLFFADDSMIFFRANANEGQNVKNIIEKYEKASGQAINLSKSGIMFSGNVHNMERTAISQLLEISTVLDTSRYLGLPSLIGKNEKQIFSYLKDRVWARLQGWRKKTLFKVGCEILFKSMAQRGYRWRIGDGSLINIWNDPWLRDPSNFFVEKPIILEVHDWTVQDLMVPGSREWDHDIMETIFENRDTKAVTEIPLGPIKLQDNRIWHFSKNGDYTVKSGYHVAMSLDANLEARKIQGNWKAIWKLNVPPKIKIFLWRACRECLSHRINMQNRGIQVASLCVVCNKELDTSWHTFITCPFARECWTNAKLRQAVDFNADTTEGFTQWVFKIIQDLSGAELSKFVTILWAIWKQKNSLLWNNHIDTLSRVVVRAMRFLNDWISLAKSNKGSQEAGPRNQTCRWTPPLIGAVKCNIDAAFFEDIKSAGISMVVRDEEGRLLMARTNLIKVLRCVKEGEAIGLLEALSWIRNSDYSNVLFEVDAMTVYHAMKETTVDRTEFGGIMGICRDIVATNPGFSVHFTRRQANEKLQVDYNKPIRELPLIELHDVCMLIPRNGDSNTLSTSVNSGSSPDELAETKIETPNHYLKFSSQPSYRGLKREINLRHQTDKGKSKVDTNEYAVSQF